MKKIKVEYILFREAGQHVLYAPQIKFACNGKNKRSLLRALPEVVRLHVQLWRDHNELDMKIDSLGLSPDIASEKKEEIDREISVPYYMMKQKYSFGSVTVSC